MPSDALILAIKNKSPESNWGDKIKIDCKKAFKMCQVECQLLKCIIKLESQIVFKSFQP